MSETLPEQRQGLPEDFDEETEEQESSLRLSQREEKIPSVEV